MSLFARIRGAMRSFLRLCLLAAFSVDTHTQATGQPAQASTELGDLQVTGARRYSVEEIKKVSALEIGKPASIPHLDAAAERMAVTGLFKTVSYRLRAAIRRRLRNFGVRPGGCIEDVSRQPLLAHVPGERVKGRAR